MMVLAKLVSGIKYPHVARVSLKLRFFPLSHLISVLAKLKSHKLNQLNSKGQAMGV